LFTNSFYPCTPSSPNYPTFYYQTPGCSYPSTYANKCFLANNSPFAGALNLTAPVNATVSCLTPAPSRTPVVAPVGPTLTPSATPSRSTALSTASIQNVVYASSSTCSGPIEAVTTFAADICILTGNSSLIVTKTGNNVNEQGYTDTACKTAGATTTIPLNTCSIQGSNAVILYAYAPNTLPSAPFTSTTGQVTETFA